MIRPNVAILFTGEGGNRATMHIAMKKNHFEVERSSFAKKDNIMMWSVLYLQA
jgi:hypothetical protein